MTTDLTACTLADLPAGAVLTVDGIGAPEEPAFLRRFGRCSPSARRPARATMSR